MQNQLNPKVILKSPNIIHYVAIGKRDRIIINGNGYIMFSYA